MRFRPASFEYKDGGRKALGFIADSMAAIDRRLASYTAKGEVNSIDLNGIVALLTATVQQQQKQIDSLRIMATRPALNASCTLIGNTPTGMDIVSCPASVKQVKP